VGGKKFLLVEGKDDEHVLRHLCKNRDLGWIEEIEFWSGEGVEGLLENFPVRLKAGEEGDIVGVVVDADTDLSARWRSLRDRLTDFGYQGVRENPDPEGTVLEPPADKLLSRVGIWIMPDNQTPGILEDFLSFLVPPNSRLYAHVQASVGSIPEGEQRFKAHDKPKAIIHTWLAWQEEPGRPLRTAITARFLNPNVTQVDDFIVWLQRLYKPGDQTRADADGWRELDSPPDR